MPGSPPPAIRHDSGRLINPTIVEGQIHGAVALGIGSALLSGLLDEAARRGAKSVFLEVRADNPPAQAMYERFGFKRIGVRRRYYDDGTDAYTMVRRLDE